MKTIVALLLGLLLAGCAAYDGYSLQPGSSTGAEVIQLMGEPAMRWPEAEGGETLVYPRGPYGFHTYFVRIDAQGRLASRENVLQTKYFARIQAGMTPEEVVRVLGPSVAAWTVYFEARDELVWEWRYCDDWNEPARFNVLFDRSAMRVRSTLAASESMRALFDRRGVRRWCGH